MGKRRIIAETGAGQHGVATATAAALLGLECCVYMGRVDMARQRLNVIRMRMLGAEVRPVDSGIGTLKDALNEAIRDWVTNVGETHYVIGTAAGPAPYPEIVAELQSVIGVEAREQMLDEEGRLPGTVVACIGGGSNAIGIFRPFLDDAEVALVGVEAGGEGIESGRHGASLGHGRPGVLHGTYSYLLQDADGQVTEPHSISAGLDYPGRRPGAQPPARHRPGALRERDRRRGADGLPGLLARRGHHPGARERARARPAGARGPRAERRRAGAGVPVRARGQGRGRRREPLWASMTEGGARIRAAFANAGRPLFMPYIMGGYPTSRRARRTRRPRPRHADLIELGIPFSDPLADGPTIQAAGQRALESGDPAGGRDRDRRRHCGAGRPSC